MTFFVEQVGEGKCGLKLLLLPDTLQEGRQSGVSTVCSPSLPCSLLCEALVSVVEFCG